MSRLLSPNDIIKSDLCIGCGICAALAGNNQINMKFDKYGQLRPTGDAKWFNLPSEIFSNICPFSPHAKNEDELSKELFPNSLRNTAIGVTPGLVEQTQAAGLRQRREGLSYRLNKIKKRCNQLSVYSLTLLILKVPENAFIDYVIIYQNGAIEYFLSQRH